MTFIVGKQCTFKVLEGNETEARIWADHVMHSHRHMEFVLTGTAPVRWFEVRDEWKREQDKGAIIHGVYAGDKFLGTCGTYNPRDIYHSAEVRFMIVDPEAIGKGVGLEAANLLTRYAYMRLNYNRLWLGVSALNLRAVKTYLDAGFLFEGKEDAAIYTHGTYWPTYRMAMTRESWEKWQRKDAASAS